VSTACAEGHVAERAFGSEDLVMLDFGVYSLGEIRPPKELDIFTAFLFHFSSFFVLFC
jgi:hypothetical protein